MRDLSDEEVEYLSDHTSDEFLANRLGYDQDDIQILNKIRETISNWCTKSCWRPTEEDLTNDEDFFSETNASEEDEKINYSLDFFDQTKYLDQKVKDTLKNILNSLEKKVKDCNTKEIAKEPPTKSEVKKESASQLPFLPFLPFQSSVAKSEVKKESAPQQVDFDKELISPKINQFNWKDYFGFDARKWLDFATFEECMYQLKRRVNFPCTNEEFNAAIGDILDYFKDAYIKILIIRLECSHHLTINDEEIKSEVIDYLFKNKYKIKITNNKIELL